MSLKCIFYKFIFGYFDELLIKCRVTLFFLISKVTFSSIHSILYECVFIRVKKTPLLKQSYFAHITLKQEIVKWFIKCSWHYKNIIDRGTYGREKVKAI